MYFRQQHELHKRRFGKNLGLGVILGSVVLIVFGLTVVKIGEGDFTDALAGVETDE